MPSDGLVRPSGRFDQAQDRNIGPDPEIAVQAIRAPRFPSPGASASLLLVDGARRPSPVRASRYDERSEVLVRNDVKRVQVFTARPVAIGVAVGVLVATAAGLLIGVSWGLALLTGLPAGALALAVSIGVRDGRFDCMGPRTTQRWRGVWMLAWIVMSTPAFLVGSFFEVRLNRDDDLVLKLLLLFTGLAAYALGGIMTMLNHLDGDDTADLRRHRVTPPYGERGSTS